MKTSLLFLLLSAVVALAGPSPQPQPKPGVDLWMHSEQKLLSRDVDPAKIVQPDVQNQNEKYRPDNGKWFEVESMWIPESELEVAALEHLIPPELMPDLVRTKKGQKEYRFFVHPESREFYKEWMAKYPVLTEHVATATSSSRSVLMRSKADPSKQYFAKLSLAVELGGVDRTIPANEIARSVGTTQYFRAHQAEVNTNIDIIPEVLGISPKGRYRGGMIIRLIPPEVARGEVTPIPLFSFYAQDADGKTLIEKWSKDAAEKPSKFVLERTIKPYAQGWVDWAVKGSLVAEDHAQNVMGVINAKGQLQPLFYRRDGGGMYINPGSAVIRKGELGQLPSFTNFRWDYQKFAGTAESRSLDTYFIGGFLYNVDKELQRIDKTYEAGSIEKKFKAALLARLREASGKKVPLKTADLDKMEATLQKVREAASGQKYHTLSHGLGRDLRVGVYTGTFDPPHDGHTQLIRDIKAALGLDLLFVVPNVETDHKPGASSYEHRKAMAEIAFKMDGVIVADKDLEAAMRSKKGVEAALDALERKFDVDTDFFQVSGDDSFARRQEIKGLRARRRFQSVVLPRNQVHEQKELVIRHAPNGEAYLEYHGRDLGYSSTKMREEMAAGRRPAQISEEVWEYIRKEKVFPLKPKRAPRNRAQKIIECIR